MTCYIATGNRYSSNVETPLPCPPAPTCPGGAQDLLAPLAPQAVPKLLPGAQLHRVSPAAPGVPDGAVMLQLRDLRAEARHSPQGHGCPWLPCPPALPLAGLAGDSAGHRFSKGCHHPSSSETRVPSGPRRAEAGSPCPARAPWDPAATPAMPTAPLAAQVTPTLPTGPPRGGFHLPCGVDAALSQRLRVVPEPRGAECGTGPGPAALLPAAFLRALSSQGQAPFYPEGREVTIHVVNVLERSARYRSSNCSR